MFHNLILILCSIVAYFLYYKIKERRRINEFLNVFDGPKPKPIVGNLLDFGTTPLEMMQNLTRIHDQYGPITKLFMGLNHIELVVTDPELLEVLLTSNKEITKGHDYNMFKPWLYNGLLVSTGQYWQKRRKILTPAFHFKILDNFIPIFSTECDILIEKLSAVAHKPSVDLTPFLSAFALDSICETAMGTSIRAQQSPHSDYCKSIKLFSEILIKRRFSFWKKNDFLFQFSGDYKKQRNALRILHGFTRSVIEQKRKHVNNSLANKKIEDENDLGCKKKIAFLDLLFKFAGDTMTNDDILEEIEVFMLTGHDITATASAFTLYEIAQNPHVQDKLEKELDEIFGNNKKIQPTMHDINSMKYLDLVLKESLRKYPAVPYFVRLLEDDLVFKNNIIPKGVSLTVFPYHMHNDPRLFKDPEVFDPDRFLLENVNKRNAFSYIPFSAGPRNCIGQKFAFIELKVVISKILRRFRLLPADPQCKLVLSGEILLRSINGVCIQLKERK